MAASSTLITDLGTAFSNGPSSTTQANAIAAAGPIQDVNDNINLAQLKLKEAKQLLNAVQQVQDTGTDGTNKTLVANVILALS